MNIHHERILPDDAPTSEQLFRLASVGIVAATKRQRLRRSRSTPKAHMFVDELHLLRTPANGEVREIHHRMAGRIGRRAINDVSIPAWSMRFLDSYWVEQDEGHWLGQRSTYRFEWKKDQTMVAKKNTIYLDNAFSDEPETSAERFFEQVTRLDITSVELLHAQMQLEEVSAGDCDELIADAQGYYGQLVGVQGDNL